MNRHLNWIIVATAKKKERPKCSWVERQKCLIGVAVWGKHRSGVDTEPLWDWPRWMKWHRAATEKEWPSCDLWPLGKVITRTLSSVVMLYLNLNPACLSLHDSCMKVAVAFGYFTETPRGNNRNKVIGLSCRVSCAFENKKKLSWSRGVQYVIMD